MGSGGVACGAIEQEVFKNPCTSPDGTFTIYLYDINPAYDNKDGKRSTSNKTAFEWAKNRGTKVQGFISLSGTPAGVRILIVSGIEGFGIDT